MQVWEEAFPEYHTGDKLDIVTETFGLHLAACLSRSDSLESALDEFEGVRHTPLMTVHKSKGLEYDTMIFLGLDDANWWSHTPQNSDGLATLFVALSRAKQRDVHFLRTKRRPTQSSGSLLASSKGECC